MKNRKPSVAGQFYPDDPKQLKTAVETYLGIAEPRKVQKVRALISPHAGYVFSGRVAASAFNQLEEDRQYENVFILASSHHYQFEKASVYCDGNFEMPYGEEKVNCEIGRKLVSDFPDVFTNEIAPHTNEHAIEVQLPFLHYKLKNEFQIVPIVIAASKPETCSRIAEALKPYFTENNLFVVSTDFSHYPNYQAAKQVDTATKDAITSNNPQILIDTLIENRKKRIPNLLTSLCGWTSVLTLLHLTRSDSSLHYQAIDYRNSGDERNYGDRREVVGYWAIVACQQADLNQNDEFYLTNEDKKTLLAVARNSIKSLFGHDVNEIDLSRCSAAIYSHCGAFVTLHKHGQLRGCIGMIESENPLIHTIRQMAVSAAIHDYRFPPVAEHELEQIEIEISVLSPLKKIDDISQIVLGKHGIYLRKGSASGVFLPQVADETGWNLEQFLGHCARDKAGIGWDGWRQSDIYIFSAVVFSESEFRN